MTWWSQLQILRNFGAVVVVVIVQKIITSRVRGRVQRLNKQIRDGADRDLYRAHRTPFGIPGIGTVN